MGDQLHWVCIIHRRLGAGRRKLRSQRPQPSQNQTVPYYYYRERERESGGMGEIEEVGGGKEKEQKGAEIQESVYLHPQSLQNHDYHSGIPTWSGYRFIPNNLKN